MRRNEGRVGEGNSSEDSPREVIPPLPALFLRLILAFLPIKWVDKIFSSQSDVIDADYHVTFAISVKSITTLFSVGRVMRNVNLAKS